MCGDCAGGIRAAVEERPKLILADICLPDASGLEMFRQIQDCGLNCQVIFISSYSEFQYAQQAVKLGAFDYLLKPIEADVLYECVRGCAEKIRSAKKDEEQRYDLDAADKVLFDVLTSNLQTDKAFFSVARRMGIPDGCRLFFGVAAGEDFLFSKYLEERGFPVLACCKARISDRVICSCFFTSPDQEERLTEALSAEFRESSSRAVCFFKAPLSSRLTSEPSAEPPLNVCLQQTLCRLLLKQGAESKGLWLFLPEKQALAPEVVKSLNLDDLRTALFQFLGFCREKGWTSNYLDFQFECFRFLETVYKQLTWVYGSPLPAGLDMHVFIEQLRKPNNLYDLFFVLWEILGEVFSEVQKDCCQSPYTRKALAIIRGRYGESLSLKSVARELHVSPSYLSSVFKADTGYPFSDYVFRHRMDIAYSLVRQGTLRIYEIGEKVGCPDVAQFSKCFKKQFGYSPKQLQGADERGQ